MTKKLLLQVKNSKRQQVCVQLPTSADNVTLLAFAAERNVLLRRLVAAAIDRCLLLAGRTAANPPEWHAAVNRRDRQTDGHRTVT